MLFWPVRDYTAYQPHGAIQERVGRYWSAAGMFINQARERHDRDLTLNREYTRSEQDHESYRNRSCRFSR